MCATRLAAFVRSPLFHKQTTISDFIIHPRPVLKNPLSHKLSPLLPSTLLPKRRFVHYSHRHHGCHCHCHIRRTICSTATASISMFGIGEKAKPPTTNAELVERLVSDGIIENHRVAEAMKRTDRAEFCPFTPYEDCACPIGFDATISAPHMHAYAVELLLPYLKPGARVLDVGSGSGFLTHIFAHLVCDRDGASDVANADIDGSAARPAQPQDRKDRGFVVGIEHIQELVELSVQNSRKSQTGREYLDNGQVTFVAGDGRKGVPELAPFDAIHVGAAAPENGIGVLIDQLKSPGALFVPVDTGRDIGSLFGTQTEVWIVKKDEKGQTTTDKLFDVNYVPLTDEAKQRAIFTSRR